MFNRHVKVSLAKNEKQSTPQDPTIAAKAWTESISAEVHKTGLKVMGGLLLYIAADTTRKVLIAKASK